MDAEQRRMVAEEIRRAAAEQGLSQAQLAARAGISEGTMTAVMHERSVHPGSIRKLRDALGIAPVASTLAREYPVDVQLVRDAVGLWLVDLDPAERAERVRAIFRAIANG